MPRGKVRTNEREWQGEILAWLKEYLAPPFTSATQEAGVEGKFPDLVLWIDREAGIGGAVTELKDLATDARDPDLVDAGRTKALSIGASHVVTWNMREAVVWGFSAGDTLKELWAYPTIPVVSTQGWRVHSKSFRERCREFGPRYCVPSQHRCGATARTS